MMPTNPSENDGNNPAPRSSQNKPQLLEATMRNVPKLKELNYAQWKNIITNSIKRGKLWDYVDGSIEEPPDQDPSGLATYYDEAAAVRNAILGSLEPAAQKYIEEALDPRDAWLALEKKYLTAEAETDSRLLSIEKQLADLRLEEGGDMIEHIAEFCRMRSQLGGTRLAMDDQACISMLYRSLPPAYRQSVLTPEGTEMKEFSALCARLTYLSQNPKPEALIGDTPRAPDEDYTNWGVPEDIIAFGLTGDKNPLLEERAAVTCRDCLLKGHNAGTLDCPQYQWRNELWGMPAQEVAPGHKSGADLSVKQIVPASRISYEFSEPVKVVLNFDELGLKPQLRKKINYPQPSAIQQCAILPIIQGRNAHIQAPSNNGKTTALAISILQIINTGLPCLQALVFVSTAEAVSGFQQAINNLGSDLPAYCSSDVTTISSLAGVNKKHIFVGTPGNILGLVHRNIIKMHKLRTVALDDMNQLIELGMQDQILEVYRHVPPLAQVIALSTSFTLPIPSTVSKMLVDPLRISVNRNEGTITGAQFYVMIPTNQKPAALSALFSALEVNGLVLLCHDFIKASNIMELICLFDIDTPCRKINSYQWDKTVGFYYLQGAMKSSESTGVIHNFKSKLNDIPFSITSSGYYYNQYDPVSNVILAATDAALSTVKLQNFGIPLINYDVPGNAEGYFERLDHWRLADPGQSQAVITFVTADTDEINVMKELEQDYGVHVAELLWDGESKKIH